MLDITVLAGGPGAEREVSLASGAAIHEALKRLGHRAELLDISPDDLSALDRLADLLFIALHGEFGEDGTLQAILDERGLRYTGSGTDAARRAMDKIEAKRCFREHGIPTPPSMVMESADAVVADRRATKGTVACSIRFGPPAVVKPAAGGSSVDITIAHDGATLTRAVKDVSRRYGRALVERYIRGPELTVGVLDDRALPVCRIETHREFYDYAAKYHDDDTRYLFETGLPEELLRRMQAWSLTAHRALGCRVFSRVDWMVDGETLEPFVLEVNTIPGFTSHSLLPKAAAAAGISFDQLCQEIVTLSMGS